MSDKNRKKPFIFKSLAALMTAALLVGCTPGEKGLGYAEDAKKQSEKNKEGNDETLQELVEKAQANLEKAKELEAKEGSTIDTTIARYSTNITKYYQAYNQFLENYNTVSIGVQTNDNDTGKIMYALHNLIYDAINVTIECREVIKHPIYMSADCSKKDKKKVEQYITLYNDVSTTALQVESMQEKAFELAANNYFYISPEELYNNALTLEIPTQQSETKQDKTDGGIVETYIEKGTTLFRNGLCIVGDVIKGAGYKAGDVIKGAGYKAVQKTGADNDKEMEYAEKGLNRLKYKKDREH